MESFFGWSINECINFLMNPNARLSNFSNKHTNQISQYLGDWGNHIKSWTEQGEVPLSIFKYEELLKSPLKEFSRLAKFLKLSGNIIQIEKAVENCSFEKLREEKFILY